MRRDRYRRCPIAGDAQLQTWRQDQAAASALDLEQDLGEGIRVAPGRIAAIHHAHGPVDMPQHDRGGVLARDAGPDALCLAEDPLDLSEQHAGKVEDMHADIEQDEPLLCRQIGLARIDVVSRAPVDAPPGELTDGSLLRTRLTSRIDDWKRKFSCTMRGTPASRQASTMSRHSCHVGAKGFCTMAGTLWEAARRTSGLCDGIVVTMSTKSRDAV